MSRVAPVLFWLALAFAVTMALLPHPPGTPLEHHDKAQHMLAFATLAGLAVPAFPGATLFRIGERLSFAGALIEVMQALPALGRDCDIRDWLADTLAAATVLLIVTIARRLAASPPTR